MVQPNAYERWREGAKRLFFVKHETLHFWTWNIEPYTAPGFFSFDDVYDISLSTSWPHLEAEVAWQKAAKSISKRDGQAASSSTPHVSATPGLCGWEGVFSSILSNLVKVALHPPSLPTPLGLHFGSEKTWNILIVSKDLSRNSVFFWTEVKPPPPQIVYRIIQSH